MQTAQLRKTPNSDDATATCVIQESGLISSKTNETQNELL